MRSSVLFVVSSAIGSLALVAACVGDDPATTGSPDPSPGPDRSTSSTTSTSSGGSSGTSGTSGTSGGPTCDAPKTLCGTACVDTNIEGNHCGRCDRGCGTGSSCTNGQCAPIQLAKSLTAPSGLAVSTNAIATIVADNVVRCAKDGCMTGGVTKLWTEAGWTVHPEHLAIDPTGTNVFFTGTAPALSDSRIYRATLASSGLKPVTITTGSTLQFSVGFATDGREHVIANPYRFQRCFAAAGSCITLSLGKDGATPTDVILAPSHYVLSKTDSAAGVLVCARPAAGASDYGTATDCGATTTLAPAPTFSVGKIDHLAVHADVVYWAELPTNGGATARVLSCPLAGCSNTPKVIATGEQTIGDLAVDATGAYWTSTTAGSVRACRDLATGCAASSVTLASGAVNPTQLGLDDKFVYYVAKGSTGPTGSLNKVAK